MIEVVKIFASIELFSNDQSRKTTFKSGYRPLFNFQGLNTKISGSIRLLESELLFPGSIADAEISFIKSMRVNHYFKSGVRFTFDEGGAPLGKGEFK